MKTQPVDNAACRALFTELEFTTLLKELAPDIQADKDDLQHQGHRRRSCSTARRSTNPGRR